MAGSLIETLSGDFDPGQYKDSYREALQAVIDAKVEGREVTQPESAQPTGGTVVDLMAALRASVEAAKKSQSAVGPSSAGPSSGAGPKSAAPAKKSVAKTAVASKTAGAAKTGKAPTTARAKAPARKAASRKSA